MSKLGLVTGYLICHSSLRCCDTDWTSRFCGSLFQLSILGCCMCNAGLKTVCRLLWASLSSGAVSPPCYWSLSGQCGHCSVVSGHCGRVTVLLVTQWSLWTCDRVTGHSVVTVVTAQWSVVSGRVTVLLVTQWSVWSLLSGQWSVDEWPCYWSLSGQCGHCSVVSGHCGRVTVLLVTQWSLWSLLSGHWSLWTSDRVTGHSVVTVVTARWSVVIVDEWPYYWSL